MKNVFTGLLLLTILFATEISAQVNSSPFADALKKFRQKDFSNALIDCDKALTEDPRNYDALYLKGNIFSSMGNHLKAVEMYSSAITVNNTNISAYRSRSFANRTLKNYDKAIEDINYCISHTSGRTVANEYSIRSSIYREIGDTAAALADLNKSLEAYPNNAYVYQQRAQLLNDQKKYTEALADINTAMTLQPAITHFSSTKINIFRQAGMIDSIKAMADNAGRTEPSTAMGYNARALQYQAAQQYKEAVADFCKAIAIDPSNIAAYSSRAIIYAVWLKKYDSAVIDFTKAISIYTTPSPSFFSKSTLASYYANRGKAKSDSKNYSYQSIMSDLDSAISLSPDYPSWWAYKATFLWQRKKHSESLVAIDSAIALEKAKRFSNMSYMINRERKASCLLELSQKNEALDFANETLLLDTNRLESWYSRGIVYQCIGDYKKAINDFSKVLLSTKRFNNCKTYAFLNRAKAYHEYGMPKEALQDIDSFISRSNLATGYLTRGIIYKRLDMPDSAIANYMEVVRKYRSCGSAAYNNVGTTQLYTGRYMPAILSLQKANELMPTSWYPYGNMGRIMQNLGDYTTALQYMDSAIVYTRTTSFPIVGKAEIYNTLGDYDKALAFAKQALMKNNMSFEANLMLAKISINKGEYQQAIAYLNKCETLQVNSTELYNARGYCYFKLKQYKKSIDEDAISQQVNLDAVYQPFYNYANEAMKALQNQPFRYNHIQWITPILNTNWLHKATCYQDSSLQLSVSCKITTKEILDTAKVFIFLNNKQLPITASLANIKSSVNQFTKENEYLISFHGLTLDKGNNIISVMYSNNRSQQLTIVNSAGPQFPSLQFAHLKYGNKPVDMTEPDEDLTAISDL